MPTLQPVCRFRRHRNAECEVLCDSPSQALSMARHGQSPGGRFKRRTSGAALGPGSGAPKGAPCKVPPASAPTRITRTLCLLDRIVSDLINFKIMLYCLAWPAPGGRPPRRPDLFVPDFDQNCLSSLVHNGGVFNEAALPSFLRSTSEASPPPRSPRGV